MEKSNGNARAGRRRKVPAPGQAVNDARPRPGFRYQGAGGQAAAGRIRGRRARIFGRGM